MKTDRNAKENLYISKYVNPFLPENLQHLSHPSKVNEVCGLKHLMKACFGR
jgi:hypothetical protein